MAYDKGVEIQRPLKRPWPGKTHVVVHTGGERHSVEVCHVSRDTMNPYPEGGTHPLREKRRARRARRMALRKHRGW